MNKTVKIVLSILIAAVVISVCAVYAYKALSGSDSTSQTSVQDQVDSSTPKEDELSETTEPLETIEEDADNQTLASAIQVPTAMQEVIDANTSYLTQSYDDSSSFPLNFVPMYRMAEVSNISDRSDSEGRKGWSLNYGSDASVEEVAAFYTQLLSTQDSYSLATENSTTKISAVAAGYTISVEVSPNNYERTGLNYTSSVQIVITQN